MDSISDISYYATFEFRQDFVMLPLSALRP
jgi:hypothetical protein